MKPLAEFVELFVPNKNIQCQGWTDLLLDDSIQFWILHLREALANTSNEVDQKLEGSGNHIVKNNLKHLEGRKNGAKQEIYDSKNLD